MAHPHRNFVRSLVAFPCKPCCTLQPHKWVLLTVRALRISILQWSPQSSPWETFLCFKNFHRTKAPKQLLKSTNKEAQLFILCF